MLCSSDVPTIDQDFRSFARNGDLNALGRVYDESSTELFALATRLLGDPVEAEDAFQGTWLAAIEQASSYDPTRRVMPWLVGILTNRVRRALSKRSTERKRNELLQRTADASPPVTSDPTALLETRELDAQVTEALESLPDVLRVALVLRYRHGMEPAEIAFALQKPPGTIRSQLTRGLASLRERLPAHLVTPAFLGMVLTPAALPAIRAIVMAKASVHLTVAAASTTATATTLTATSTTLVLALMTKTTLIVAGIALAGVAGFLLWPDTPPVPKPDPVTQDSAHALAAPATGALASNTRVEPSPTTNSANRVAVDRENIGRSLEVCVTHEGKPVHRALVALFASPYSQNPYHDAPTLGQERDFVGATCPTDEDGIARFDQLCAGNGYAKVVGARGSKEQNTRTMTSFSLKDDQCVQVELTVPAPSWIRGIVCTETGSRLAEADVWIDELRRPKDAAHSIARTEADGTFECAVWSDTLIGASAATRTPTSREVQVTTGSTHEVILQLDGGGSTLRGVVVDANSKRPIGGAHIVLGDSYKDHQGPLRIDGARNAIVPYRLVSEADGSFEASGLAPGHLAVFSRHVGYAQSRIEVDLPSGDEIDLRIEMSQGATLIGRVQAKKPVRQVSVEVLSPDAASRIKIDVEKDGTFELRDLPPGSHRVRVAALGSSGCEASLVFVAGETTEWNPTLDLFHNGLEGTLVDEGGQPLPDWRVVVHWGDGYSRMSPTRTDKDGRYQWYKFNNPNIRFRNLRIYPPGEDGNDGYPSEYPLMEVRDVESGKGPRTIVVPRDQVPSARLTGALKAAKGRHTTYLALIGPMGCRQLVSRDEDGRFTTDLLMPGTWTIATNAYPKDHALLRVELRAEETKDVGVIDVPLQTHGTLNVKLDASPRLVSHAAEFKGEAALEIVNAESNKLLRWAQLHEGDNKVSVPPGRYKIGLAGAPVAPDMQTVEVAPGATIQLRFASRPAMLLHAMFRHPGTDHTPTDLTIEVVQGNARSAERTIQRRVVPSNQGQWVTQLNLEPGNYTLFAATHTGLKLRVPLVIDATRPYLRPLIFTLAGE